MAKRPEGHHHQSEEQPLDDLWKDFLTKYKTEIDKNASGEVVAIRVFKNNQEFELTITGHTAGDAVAETLTVTPWERQ